MKKETQTKSCEPACCKVEAVVSIDARGQMVLPKELREKMGLQAGDKLVVTSLEKEGKSCCLLLTRAEELAGMMRGVLSPLMKETPGSTGGL